MEVQMLWCKSISQLSENQTKVLKKLKHGEYKQAELANATGMKPSTLSETIGLFEKSGIVATKRTGRDKIVFLTVSGKEMLKDKSHEIDNNDKRSVLVFL